MIPVSSVEARDRGYEVDEVASIELAEEAAREAAKSIPIVEEVIGSPPNSTTTLRSARAIDDETTFADKFLAFCQKYEQH
jgi:hypothetical protein